MSQFHPDAGLCRNQQIFQVWVRPVPPEQGVFAMRIAKYELDKLVKNGLTQGQFESTREFLTKYLAVLVKSQDRQLGYAMDSRWYGMKDFVGTMRQRLAALTLDQVNRAIKRHLAHDRLHIVFITKDAEKLKSVLTSGAPSPISYTSKKPQGILDEDKIVERYPLDIDSRNVRIVDVSEVFEKQ
jgi:zinc protease